MDCIPNFAPKPDKNLINAIIFIQFIRTKNSLRSLLGQYPSLFFPCVVLRRKNAHLKVNRDTEITIEGFPRSGNTFAFAAFTLAQNRPVNIARHLHVPAQVIKSCNLKVPTLVLIRQPIDAIVSRIIREKYISVRQALREYIRYYKRIIPHSDCYVVGTFNEVTTDFGKIINKINNRFNTQFLTFEHNSENIKRCFALIEDMDKLDRRREKVTETHVARPSSMRKKEKAKIMNQIEVMNLDYLIKEAEDLYDRFASYAK